MQNLIPNLESAENTVFLPMMLKADFAEAKSRIHAFRRWPSYGDHVAEIEGYFMGLTSAGLDARLISLAFCGFNCWAAHAAKKFTVKNLREFSRIVAIARDNPVTTIKILRDDDKAVLQLNSDLGETTTVIQLDFYRYWQSTPPVLSLGGLPLTPEAYCHLLLERWTEEPRNDGSSAKLMDYPETLPPGAVGL